MANISMKRRAAAISLLKSDVAYNQENNFHENQSINQ